MEAIQELPTPETIHARKRINAGLATPESPLVAIQGPCAPELKSAHITLNETRTFGLIGRILTGLVAVQSLPMSKPRTNPEAWSGLDSTSPEYALEMIRLASQHSAVAMEIVRRVQIGRYVPNLALAWTGARADEDFDLKLRLASYDQTLPMMIKNGLNGEIDLALEHIERLKAERDVGASSIVLCFRGGTNAKTPEAWENRYVQALEITGGLMVVDTAHGSEMAFDPNLEFQKSVQGQSDCLGRVVELAQYGHKPAGVKIEASDAPSPIDPVIPLQGGFDAIQRLGLAVS